MNNKNELLEVVDLHKSFIHNGKILEVLKGVNLYVKKGELVSIMGKSGVGKSTLFHILGTLDLPSRGEVYYEGLNVFGLKEKELAVFRNSYIGFVFQFHYLLPEWTAMENVIIPAIIAKEKENIARERAEFLLKEVGLGERLNHRPSELSGGEQQRVAIARALIMQPKIVLADEPTGNLDQATSEEIHDLFIGLNEKTQITFLVATHNISFAKKMKRHMKLINGVLVEEE